MVVEEHSLSADQDSDIGEDFDGHSDESREVDIELDVGEDGQESGQIDLSEDRGQDNLKVL